MPHLDPGWRSALALAAVLALLALLLRRTRVGVAAREATIVALMYAAWCLVGLATHPHPAGALERGTSLFHLERSLHFPSELTVQSWVLPHDWLGHAVNAYYVYGHVNVIGLCLAWTWWRHRGSYTALRLELIGLTLICEALQLYAVAPPRLLPELGFVDLGNRYGESVYGSYGRGLPSQLLAMPSLHVGWAALVAWTVWRCGSGPWRWVGVVHLVLMTLVVVASGNHWWMDGVVAVAILSVVIAVVERFRARVLVEA